MSIVLDPYARLSFLTQSSVTEKKEKSLCPTWDQTLIFEELEIYGDPRAIEENPPEVMIELFDYDKFVSTIMFFIIFCVINLLTRLKQDIVETSFGYCKPTFILEREIFSRFARAVIVNIYRREPSPFHLVVITTLV